MLVLPFIITHRSYVVFKISNACMLNHQVMRIWLLLTAKINMVDENKDTLWTKDRKQ